MQQYGAHMTSEVVLDEDLLLRKQLDVQEEEVEATPASVSWLLALPFAITFCDSAFSYFMRPFGFTMTANVVIPLVLLVIGLFLGASVLRIAPTYVLWLSVLVLGLSMAVVTARNVSNHRMLEAGGCAVAFYSGYILWRQCGEAKQLTMILSTLSFLYISICVIALLKIDPVHFPLTVNYWNMDGVGQARPRVTADANMQFYYLFPATLVLVLPTKILRTSVAIAAAIGTLYILSMLQTRSGVIVFGFILFLTLAAPAWKPELGWEKTIAIPVLGMIAAIAAWPVIEQLTAALLYRFHDSTMLSGNGRVGSTLYFFDHLLDPRWWLPRSADEYVKRFGQFPHSNLTGMYLDGGLLGLIAWCMLVLRPLLKGVVMFFANRLDAVAVMALIAGMAVMMLQLSLFNTTMDQIWLWAGALAGALGRIESSSAISTE